MPISVVTTGISKSSRERAQLAARVAVDDAAAGVDQRPLRFAEHREELVRLGAVDDVGASASRCAGGSRGIGSVPAPWNAPCQFCTSFGTSMTTGPGPAGARDLERRAHRRFELASGR